MCMMILVLQSCRNSESHCLSKICVMVTDMHDSLRNIAFQNQNVLCDNVFMVDQNSESVSGIKFKSVI